MDVRHNVLTEPRIRDDVRNRVFHLVADGAPTTQQRRYLGVLILLLYVDIPEYNPPSFLAFPAPTYLHLVDVGSTVRSILRRALTVTMGTNIARPAITTERGDLGRKVDKVFLASDIIPEAP